RGRSRSAVRSRPCQHAPEPAGGDLRLLARDQSRLAAAIVERLDPSQRSAFVRLRSRSAPGETVGRAVGVANAPSIYERNEMSAKRIVLQSILDRCGRGDDGYDCFREGSAHRVRLWGDLPPAWPGSLSLHVSALGIEIVSCDAARIGVTRWAATLLLRATDLR